MKVYFVGAGPGDPQLLTLKGREALAQADVIIYAGSLVNPAVLKFARKDAAIYDSSSMSLEEIFEIYTRACEAKQKVVRLHTGDPSVYGAIQEQIDWLAEQNIAFEIIPGVSSFAAAAASLKRELTLPGVSQTVILTRFSRNTPLPEKEKLADLAKYQSTLCLFLSVAHIKDVVKELKASYPDDTPVVVIEKASWPEEKIIWGDLKNIATRVRQEGVKKTALIVVGNVLKSSNYQRSWVYSKDARRKRTEDRGQRTEDRRQRTEDRRQRTEDRGQ